MTLIIFDLDHIKCPSCRLSDVKVILAIYSFIESTVYRAPLHHINRLKTLSRAVTNYTPKDVTQDGKLVNAQGQKKNPSKKKMKKKKGNSTCPKKNTLYSPIF